LCEGRHVPSLTLAPNAVSSPLLKPFIGLEVAVPLSSKSFDAAASDSENLKSLAPKLQVGVYAGLRF